MRLMSLFLSMRVSLPNQLVVLIVATSCLSCIAKIDGIDK